MRPSDQDLLRALLKEQTRGTPSAWRSHPSLLEDREMSPLAWQVMKNEKDRNRANWLRGVHYGRKN